MVAKTLGAVGNVLVGGLYPDSSKWLWLAIYIPVQVSRPRAGYSLKRYLDNLKTINKNVRYFLAFLTIIWIKFPNLFGKNEFISSCFYLFIPLFPYRTPKNIQRIICRPWLEGHSY